MVTRGKSTLLGEFHCETIASERGLVVEVGTTQDNPFSFREHPSQHARLSIPTPTSGGFEPRTTTRHDVSATRSLSLAWTS